MMRLRNQLVAIFSLILVLSIPACATVEGIGKDIQAGGKGISKGARYVAGTLSSD